MKYYCLKFENVPCWVRKKDKDYETYFERENISGTIFLEKPKREFLVDNMLCNYRNAEFPSEGIRIYEADDFLVIEPSGIRLPKENLIELSGERHFHFYFDDTINKLTDYTFFCNAISAFTRGGKETITLDEYKQFRNNILGANFDKATSIKSLSPFEFVRLFCIFKADTKNYNFFKDDLIEQAFDYKQAIDYKEMLQDVNVYRHEHNDISYDIEYALLLLKYYGSVRPDYTKNNDYLFLSIDPEFIRRYELENDRENHPLMVSFVDDYNKEYDKSYNRRIY